MSDLVVLVQTAVTEQINALVPDVVGVHAICSPDVVFHVAGFPAAGANSSRLDSSIQTNGSGEESGSHAETNLDPITAKEVLNSSREPEVWRNLTKFVTEDVARNVASVDGFRYTYRNRDKQTLKSGVRSEETPFPGP